jgi:hypothetical protein
VCDKQSVSRVTRWRGKVQNGSWWGHVRPYIYIHIYIYIYICFLHMWATHMGRRSMTSISQKAKMKYFWATGATSLSYKFLKDEKIVAQDSTRVRSCFFSLFFSSYFSDSRNRQQKECDYRRLASWKSLENDSVLWTWPIVSRRISIQRCAGGWAFAKGIKVNQVDSNHKTFLEIKKIIKPYIRSKQ